MEIKIESLQKCFGPVKAVDIASCEMHGGEIIGLVGNNGAGKTTLIRLMTDLLEADSGRVLFDGVSVAENEDWKQVTGVYVDDGFLIDYLTPDEYFEFVGSAHGLSPEEVHARLVPYEGLMNGEIAGQKKYLRDLSQGNRQKAGILAAMLIRPQLLILDEPFNFLDPRSQVQIRHLLQQFNASTGATILLSSHNLTHTVDICKRIILLESGVILRDIANPNGEAAQELEAYFEAEAISG